MNKRDQSEAWVPPPPEGLMLLGHSMYSQRNGSEDIAVYFPDRW